ncbi:MAG: integration host factor subunit beta [Kiritimatiellae bacterium]|nr:integration host factor subunit beta [Kiritimatiellia bacterium]MBQ2281958.1 integration host factor subunit beta [Kiritimatiellia bacterium]
MKNTLTKKDIALALSKAENINLTQTEAYDVVQTMLAILSDELVNGAHIEFRDFGVFDVVLRKARIGRNPNQPDAEVDIPARYGVKFKPSKALQEKLAQKK